jgi:methyl-accepting chemotaxis protein
MNEATKAILEMGDQSREIEALMVELAKATDEQGRRMPIEISDLIPLVPEIAKLVSERRAMSAQG